MAWFDNRLPTNIMVPGRQPWLDIAPAEDKSDHPPDPIISAAAQAGFWYNPNRGIFRARVLPQFTDEETLALYNQLNGTALRAFPRASEPYPKPHPASLTPVSHQISSKLKPVTPRTTLVDH